LVLQTHQQEFCIQIVLGMKERTSVGIPPSDALSYHSQRLSEE
jgi:hypothetical protein